MSHPHRIPAISLDMPVIVRPLRAPVAYQVGQRVLVHAMGSFYPGTVTRVTARTVTAEYTSGAGVTRTVTANPRVEYFGNLRDGRSYQGPRILNLGEVR